MGGNRKANSARYCSLALADSRQWDPWEGRSSERGGAGGGELFSCENGREQETPKPRGPQPLPAGRRDLPSKLPLAPPRVGFRGVSRSSNVSRDCPSGWQPFEAEGCSL